MPRDERNPLVKKLHLQQEQGKQRQVDTLLHFQERVHRKVRAHNDFGKRRCGFEIPLYTPGLPLYDAYWVTQRIIKILRRDGFYVEGVLPTTIVIDWSTEKLEQQLHDNTSKKQHEKTKRAEKKKKKNPPKVIKL